MKASQLPAPALLLCEHRVDFVRKRLRQALAAFDSAGPAEVYLRLRHLQGQIACIDDIRRLGRDCPNGVPVGTHDTAVRRMTHGLGMFALSKLEGPAPADLTGPIADAVRCIERTIATGGAA